MSHAIAHKDVARLSKWLGDLAHYLRYAGDGEDSYTFGVVEEIEKRVRAVERGEGGDAYYLPVAIVGRGYTRLRKRSDDGA